MTMLENSLPIPVPRRAGRRSSGSSTTTTMMSASASSLDFAILSSSPAEWDRSRLEDSGYLSGASSTTITSPSTLLRTTAAVRYQHDQLAHQRIFADKRTRLLSLIDSTRDLVRQVQDANSGDFAVRLPVPSSLGRANKDHTRYNILCPAQKSVEISDEDQAEEMGCSAAASCPDLLASSGNFASRPLVRRSLRRRPSEPTTPWGWSSESAATSLPGSLQVLNLDLKMGNTHLRSSLITPESVSSLLDERLTRSLAHLDALMQRVADPSSKILVTGDLNAGKSTFVNALLRREILPVDQQPCTTLFCEVLDATQENGGIEEVHALPVESETKYDRADPRTYVKVDMRHLEKLIDNNHGNYSQLKIYCSDCRSASESLLHNGIANIALVDSPGLNRDSLKTTALFARQQEIDVVVFVVSAENHFTLSGKEFLWNAGNEKAHIFIVVNRFDLIHKTDKCRREILDQIRQLSPHTYEDADDLVHFVSAEKVLQTSAPNPDVAATESFARLEECLRNFVLDKRARSKLLPAKRYLSKLLSDLCAIASWNREAHAAELEVLTRELERDAGAVEELESAKKNIEEGTEKIIEDISRELELEVRTRLENATETLHVAAMAAEWTGILSAWTYALEVRDRLVEHIMNELRATEAHVHRVTVEAVRAVRAMGTKVALPNDALASQNSVPSTSASMLDSHPDSLDSKDSGRLRERPLTLRVELADFLVDPREHLNVLSLSGCAVAMFGTFNWHQNMFGAMWKVVGVLGAPKVHKTRIVWTVFGFCGIGALAYLFSDVRRTVERRLALKLRQQLSVTGYAEAQAARAARRSRRQLRLAGWDLRNRFHTALQREERKRSDRLARRDAACVAEEWFAKVYGGANRIGRRVAEIEVDGQGHELA